MPVNPACKPFAATLCRVSPFLLLGLIFPTLKLRARLFAMKRPIPCLAMLLCTALAASGGPVRTFRGNGFLVGIAEPQGWVINMNAPQLAQFVLHRMGKTWREADSVIFVRLIPRQADQRAEAFVQSNVQDFEQSCVAPEVRDVDLKMGGQRKFWIKSYDCASMRHEVTAVTEVPGFFILFVLTSRGGPATEPIMTAYREVLTSFVWRETPRQPMRNPG